MSKERLIKHWDENKKFYLGVGVGVAVGVGGALILTRPSCMKIVTDSYKLQINSPTSNIVIPALGDPGNVVRCVETGLTYASQGQLARDLGLSATAVSKHLHGKLPDLFGLHYVVVGKAGFPLA